MQELIPREEVISLVRSISNATQGIDILGEIYALPTTVHHEYKVGEEYSFSND